MKIGVVGDTHGLLRPEVLPKLKGVESIPASRQGSSLLARHPPL